MGGYGGQLALVVVLIGLNAVFAGSEMALVTLRDSQIQRLERESRGGRVLARLARDPNRFLATIQIGITLAGFLASATAAVALAQPLVPALSVFGSGAESVAIVLVTLVLTFVTLVFGELAPKRIAMQRAERWALLVARPLDVLATVARPAVWLLGRSTDLVVRLTGNNPAAGRDEVTTEEIRDLIEAQADFTADQRTILSGAFEIAERVLREIVIPRRDVTSIPAGASAAEAAQILVETGHSRAPVAGPAGIDDVIGTVHLRDLVGTDATAAELARPSMLLPESLKVTDALRRMRDEHEQFAIVVDEYGAVEGIITMEDLVEEIVGEIYDEFDRDIQTVQREADGALVLPGGFPLHDLTDLGVELDRTGHGDYATVAGLVLDHLGRVPTRPGETVAVEDYTAEILKVKRNAITEIRLRRAPAADEGDAPG
ncbi:hemolysin family protein [Glycomyces sp. A-F 0318]|uniref:hemolysin family protein n=1 Tax=Glycomyces amatae TaxID=2881355 RepID=UPI001E38A5AD|nr:hemolysin family protein [Glycomyces amatae]